MKKWRRESVLDFYNLVLAVVLLASPWLFTLTNRAGRLDMLATGVAIAAISLGAIVAYASWEEWMNLLLGLWLVASPWILGFTHTRAMHFSIALGAVVAFLAMLELWLDYEANYLGREAPPATPEQHS
jgi:SPW repeat